MARNWKARTLRQRFSTVQRLELVPDLKRTEHFLKTDMAYADQQARQTKELKPVLNELKPRDGETTEDAADKLINRLTKHARRDEKMRAILENLYHLRGEGGPRALPAVTRRNYVDNKQNQRH